MKKILLWLFFFLNLLAIGYFWWRGSGHLFLSSPTVMDYTFLGRLTGLLAVYFVLWELLLIGRIKPLEQAFGQDNLSRWHHWTGFLALVFILAHPIFLALGYGISAGRNIWSQILVFLGWPEMLPAGLAVLAFLFVVLMSIVIIKRRLKYEIWYYIHLAVYLGIIWAFGHQLTTGGDFVANKTATAYWIAMYVVFIGTYVVYRVLVPIYNFWRQGFRVTRIEPAGKNTLSVYFEGKNLNKFKARAGQFVLIRFLNKYWWQAHPFSLSAAPDGKSLRITIKALGDFTNNLDQKIKVGDYAVLEGPMGIFTLGRAKKSKLLFIAGGVGITPIRALMEEADAKKLDTILINSNRTANDIICGPEIERLVCDTMKCIHVHSDPTCQTAEVGHVDEARLRRLVPDITERDIYYCGPPPMTKSLMPILSKLGVPKSQIHYEKFSF